MMTRVLILVNVVALALAAMLVAVLVRELAEPWALPLPPGTLGRPVAATARERPGPGPLAGFHVVAAKNPFSPDRTESPGTGSAAVPDGPRPVLQGVVLDGSTARAYLEDPVAARVVAVAVGDAVGNGRVVRIASDRVVIARPDGPLEVLLNDPTKPRPAPAPPAAAASATAAPPASTPPVAAIPSDLLRRRRTPAVTPASPAQPADARSDRD